ncbi:MAG: DNA mismatch repair protein MutL, partial [Verrucomicrobiota bacterium]
PTCLGNTTAQTILAEVALSLEQAGSRGGQERWAEEKIARAACRTAVQSRDRLSLDEIEKLVIDLARADMPYTSPFGRPTLIFMSFQELNRKFGK